MHAEHQHLATMLKIFQMPITFLHTICPVHSWFSYANQQKNIVTLCSDGNLAQERQ